MRLINGIGQKESSKNPQWLSVYDLLSVIKEDTLSPLNSASTSVNTSNISTLEPDSSLCFFKLKYQFLPTTHRNLYIILCHVSFYNYGGRGGQTLPIYPMSLVNFTSLRHSPISLWYSLTSPSFLSTSPCYSYQCSSFSPTSSRYSQAQDITGHALIGLFGQVNASICACARKKGLEAVNGLDNAWASFFEALNVFQQT